MGFSPMARTQPGVRGTCDNATRYSSPEDSCSTPRAESCCSTVWNRSTSRSSAR